MPTKAKKLKLSRIQKFVDNSDIDTKKGKEISPNGFKVSFLLHALEVYVRRNELDKALWCSAELYLFSFAEDGEKVVMQLINMLMMIFLKDIGPYGISLWLRVDFIIEGLIISRKQQKSLKKRRIGLTIINDHIKEEMELIIDLVTMLCRSKHSLILVPYYKSIVLSNNDDILDFIKVYYPDVYEIHENIKNIDDDIDENKVIMLDEGEKHVEPYIEKLTTALKDGNPSAIYWTYQLVTSKVKNNRGHIPYQAKNNSYYLFTDFLRQYVKKYKYGDSNDELDKVEIKIFHILNIIRKWSKQLKGEDRILIAIFPIIALLHYEEIDWENNKESSDDSEIDDPDTKNWENVYSINVYNRPIDFDDIEEQGELYVENEYYPNIPDYEDIYEAIQGIEEMGLKKYLKSIKKSEKKKKHHKTSKNKDNFYSFRSLLTLFNKLDENPSTTTVGKSKYLIGTERDMWNMEPQYVLMPGEWNLHVFNERIQGIFIYNTTLDAEMDAELILETQTEEGCGFGFVKVSTIRKNKKEIEKEAEEEDQSVEEYIETFLKDFSRISLNNNEFYTITSGQTGYYLYTLIQDEKIVAFLMIPDDFERIMTE